MVDYSLRVGYLLALEGGNISALARSFGLDGEGNPRVSRRTLRRMLTGRQSVEGENRRRIRSFTPEVRNRVNRAFRDRATNAARRQESVKRGANKDQQRVMPELMDEANARRFERAMRRLGLPVRVGARIAVAYLNDTGDIPLEAVEIEYSTIYSQNAALPTVDEAKDNLIDVLTAFINEDHDAFGNSPIRIIVDPLPEGFANAENLIDEYGGGENLPDGAAYSYAFRYRVWRPMEGE